MAEALELDDLKDPSNSNHSNILRFYDFEKDHKFRKPVSENVFASRTVISEMVDTKNTVGGKE